MHNTEFNNWDLYPINLKPTEVENPLLVLKDFFGDDWLPGHLERLKEWRKYVLTDDYYKGPKNSPAELLYFHKLNICLVEAMHIFKVTGSQSGTLVTADQLEQEKNTWRDFPDHLNEIELLNPLLVIQDFFSSYHLPQYRAMLYEWLEFGLSAKASKEFIETGDLVAVYEHLQKLYAAAWLIHQRLSDQPFLKILSEVTYKKQENISPTAITLYNLNQAVNSGDQLKIGKLISIIKHKVPSV